MCSSYFSAYNYISYTDKKYNSLKYSIPHHYVQIDHFQKYCWQEQSVKVWSTTRNYSITYNFIDYFMFLSPLS